MESALVQIANIASGFIKHAVECKAAWCEGCTAAAEWAKKIEGGFLDEDGDESPTLEDLWSRLLKVSEEVNELRAASCPRHVVVGVELTQQMRCGCPSK